MAGKAKDDERNAHIIEVWNARPELSAQGVGDICGVTRDIVCAVIYRARRQPVNPVTRSGNRVKPPKPKRATDTPKPPRKDVIDTPQVSPYTMGLRVRELRENQCRYVVADGEAFAFCEEVQADGASYCVTHCRLCYRKEPARATGRTPDRRTQQKGNSYG